MKNKKLISLLTGVSFILSQFILPGPLWAAAGTPAVSEVSIPKTFKLELPPELGTIEMLSTGDGPTLIHIQEAHGSHEVQKKISKILHYLKDQYGIDLILLEGNAFKLKPSLVRLFPDDMQKTRAIVESLAEDGIVSGPELFFLDEPQAEAFGIENLKAYNENGTVFVEVLKAREQSQVFLNEMELQIERLTSPYLNKDLRYFLKRVDAYEAHSIPFDKWREELKPYAKQYLETDLDNPWFQMEWPMLLRVFTLKKLENKMNQNDFGKERPDFLHAIKGIPGNLHQEIERLLSLPISHHRLPDPETGLLFENMIRALPKNFDHQAYPQVDLFIGHLILQSELNGEELIDEILRLTDQISNKLAPRDEEKQIVALLKELRLLKRLFRLELTPEEYEKVEGGRSKVEASAFPSTLPLRPSTLIKRFRRLNTNRRVRDARFERVDEIDKLFDQALAFYRGAKERDKAMLKNIEQHIKQSLKFEVGSLKKKMKKGERALNFPASPAGGQLQTSNLKLVVITGGFHSGPFQDYFKQRNYNYALITPQMTELKGQEQYIQRMLASYGESVHAAPATYRAGEVIAGIEGRFRGLTPERRIADRRWLEKSIVHKLGGSQAAKRTDWYQALIRSVHGEGEGLSKPQAHRSPSTLLGTVSGFSRLRAEARGNVTGQELLRFRNPMDTISQRGNPYPLNPEMSVSRKIDEKESGAAISGSAVPIPQNPTAAKSIAVSPGTVNKVINEAGDATAGAPRLDQTPRPGLEPGAPRLAVGSSIHLRYRGDDWEGNRNSNLSQSDIDNRLNSISPLKADARRLVPKFGIGGSPHLAPLSSTQPFLRAETRESDGDLVFPPETPNELPGLKVPYTDRIRIVGDPEKKNYQSLYQDALRQIELITNIFSSSHIRNPEKKAQASDMTDRGPIEAGIYIVFKYLAYAEHLMELSEEESRFLTDLNHALSQLNGALQLIREGDANPNTVGHSIVNANHFIEYLTRARQALLEHNFQQRYAEASDMENRRRKQMDRLKALFEQKKSSQSENHSEPSLLQDPEELDVNEGEQEIYVGIVKRDDHQRVFALIDVATLFDQRGQSVVVPMNPELIKLPAYEEAQARKRGEMDVDVPVFYLRGKRDYVALPTPFGYEVTYFSPGESYDGQPVRYKELLRDDMGVTYVWGLENAETIKYRLAKRRGPISSDLAKKFTDSYELEVPLTEEDKLYEQMLASAKTVEEKVRIIKGYMRAIGAVATLNPEIRAFLKKASNFFQAQRLIGCKGACQELNTYLANEFKRHGIPALITHDLSFAENPETKQDSVMVQPGHVRVIYFDETNRAHVIDATKFVDHDSSYGNQESSNKEHQEPSESAPEQPIDAEKLKELEKQLASVEGDSVLGFSSEQIQGLRGIDWAWGGHGLSVKRDEEEREMVYRKVFQLQHIRENWQTLLESGNLPKILESLRFLQEIDYHFVGDARKHISFMKNREAARLLNGHDVDQYYQEFAERLGRSEIRSQTLDHALGDLLIRQAKKNNFPLPPGIQMPKDHIQPDM